MASLDDILTTQKNGVVAINALNNITLGAAGTVTSVTVTGPTVVFVGSGRLVNFAVLVAGSANGFIHNASTAGGVTAANALCATPNTVGVYQCGQIFTNGLVIDPGAGQSVNVTYSSG
jgi:hypothetical protein